MDGFVAALRPGLARIGPWPAFLGALLAWIVRPAGPGRSRSFSTGTIRRPAPCLALVECQRTGRQPLADGSGCRSRCGFGAAVPAALALLVLLAGGILPAPAAGDPADGPAIRFRAGADDITDRIVLESAGPFQMSRTQEGTTTLLRFDRPLQGDLGRLTRQLTRSILSAGLDGANLRLRLAHRVALHVHWASEQRLVLALRRDPSPAPADPGTAGNPPYPALLAEEPVHRPEDPSHFASPGPALATALHLPAPRDDLTPALPPFPEQGAEDRLAVRTVRLPGMAMAVDYRWNRPVSAAAFMRDDRLWLVFDARIGRLAADTIALARDLEGRVVDAERQIGAGHLLFRLQLAPGIEPHLAPLENGWRLTLAGSPGTPGQPGIGPRRMPAPVPAEGSLRFAMRGPVLPLADPRAGDRLLVVPAGPDLAAPVAAAAFPEIEILPSLAGLVLRPLRQDILAEPNASGLTVRRADRQPLHLEEFPRIAAAPDPAPPRLDFAGLGGRLADRRDAEAALADRPGNNAVRARLARILLGMGLADEARVVLAAAPSSDPTLALLAEVTEALRDPRRVRPEQFLDPAAGDVREAALWRAYLLGRQGDAASAMAALAASRDVLFLYPPVLRRILGEALVATQIAAGDMNGALATADRLLAEAVDGPERAAWKLLRARALLREDARPAARRQFDAAAAGGDPDTMLAAQGALVDLDLEEGRSDPSALSVALTARASSWQGRRVQAVLDDRHARIAAQAGDWQTALDAADRAARAPGADELAGRLDPVTLLGQALAAPDLDLFGKLALLAGRPLDELRNPALAGLLAGLAGELAGAGHHAAGQMLRRALPSLATHPAARPARQTGFPGDAKAGAAPSVQTRAFLAGLDPARLADPDGLVRIGQVLETIARVPEGEP